MDLNSVHQHIDDNRARYLASLEQILVQPSVSAQNLGVRDCAKLLVSLLESLGMSASIRETRGQPCVFGELRCDDPEALTVLFYGHYDVQPTDPLEAWISPPFEPTIRDGRLYCRGAADNKGQLITHLLAIRSYQETVGRLPISVKVILDGEEESGSPNLAAFVEENKELLAADVVYASDGPMHDQTTPAVLLGHRGILAFQIDLDAARHDNHSGNKGGVIPNAAWEMVRLLSTMIGDDGRVLIDGFYDEVMPVDAVKQRLIDALPYDPAATAETFGVDSIPYDKQEFYKRMMFQPTLTINTFKSGYMGEGTKTIIPCHAMVRMDARLTIDQDGKHLFETIRRHVERVCPAARLTYLSQMLPCYTDPELDVTQSILRAVRAVYQTEPVVIPLTGGSLPSYVWTKILGIPYIGVPYANPDENNHAPNENMGLQNFYTGIHTSAQVIHELGLLRKKR